MPGVGGAEVVAPDRIGLGLAIRVIMGITPMAITDRIRTIRQKVW